MTQKFREEFQQFASLAAKDNRFTVRWEDRYPCLGDRCETTSYDRHYVLHTGWAARVLAETRPSVHVDFGSSLYFASIASAFVSMRFYDYRPALVPLPNFRSGSADLTQLQFADGEFPSVSCMHVLEHIGLGRYGDPMDATGDLKAAGELTRVLAKGGQLLMVVPVGQPRVMFNAHRIYSYEHVLDMFSGLRLRQFALIPDDTSEPKLIMNAPAQTVLQQNYGCGCFWFEKQEL
ncbi:MAG: DUF268 domain-containing protein [Terriglobales bacterium]